MSQIIDKKLIKSMVSAANRQMRRLSNRFSFELMNNLRLIVICSNIKGHGDYVAISMGQLTLGWEDPKTQATVAYSFRTSLRYAIDRKDYVNVEVGA